MLSASSARGLGYGLCGQRQKTVLGNQLRWLAHTVAQSARLSAEKESGEIIMQRATMLLAPLGALLKRSERVHSRTKGRVLENFRKFRLSKLCSAAIVVIGVNFTYYMGGVLVIELRLLMR